VLDTAGIRETDDPVEMEGVRRARDRAARADLVLWVVDAREKGPPPPEFAFGSKTWLIRNKIDMIIDVRCKTELELQKSSKNEGAYIPTKLLRNMVKNQLTDKNELESTSNGSEFNLSSLSGAGFDRLLTELANYASDFLSGAESALVTRARHRHALEDVLTALRRALSREEAGKEDILAEELHIAARALGRLTGRVDVEDILDVIFRDFCIGK
jgi:tRNA modification GTPase